MHDKHWESFKLITQTWCLSKLGESLDVFCLQGKGYFCFAYPVGVSRGAWELLWMFILVTLLLLLLRASLYN
jgi:hypothetical protein